MAPRGGGLSNKNKVSYGRVGSSSIKQTIIPVNKTALQRAASQRTYNDMIAVTGLSFVQRDEMLELGQDIDMPYTYSEDDSYYLGEPDDDEWVDVPTGIHAFPPGEEAIPQSHAGGEAIMHQIMEGMRPGRGDPRTRSFRVQKQVNAWQSQLPLLVDAYLQYKNIGAVKTAGIWPLNVVGFEESGERLFSHPADITRTNQTLLHHGYIGGSPEKPAIVFSIRTFEIYRQAHRVCPRYTINSLAKTLSHLHKLFKLTISQVPRKSYLAEQLTTAYNAYLVILREVDLRMQRALGRDETWNSKNLVDSTFRAGHPRFDNRKSSSFRWLTPSEVDKYMNEVKNAPKVSMVTFAAMAAVTAALATSPITYVPPDVPGSSALTSAAPCPTSPQSDQERPSTSGSSAEAAAADFPEGPADVQDDRTPTETSPGSMSTSLTPRRLTSSKDVSTRPEAQKKMFAIFAISGIFISVCHHGHVLVMCNMIRSGELMKYLLAIVAKLFELYGADAGIGYDIISLGRKTVGLCMHGIVLAFHGHAHNRMCQLGWRPMYVEGAERIEMAFSNSLGNGLFPIVPQLALTQQHHPVRRPAAPAVFLGNVCKICLLISAGLEDFEECERTFCLSNNLASCTQLATPFHRQQQIDEHFYFHDLDKHASSGNFIFQNYCQAVEKITANTLKLQILEDELHTMAADYEKDLKDEREHLSPCYGSPPRSRPLPITWSCWPSSKAPRPEITVIRTRYRTMYTRLLQVEEEVSRFEEEHGYKVRWTTASKEYQDALLLMNERCYWRALDKLECLVVQRLLELTKLLMSGVGTRSMLNPPREKLVWVEVIQTVTLAEFNLLRDTRTDIRKLPWTQLARREAGLLAIVNTQMTDPNLAHELSKRWNYMVWINDSVVKWSWSTKRIMTKLIRPENSKDWTQSHRPDDRKLRDKTGGGLRLVGKVGPMSVSSFKARILRPKNLLNKKKHE
ncbi:hypothetical protein DFH09DRAFT_1093639 [Mycena vulgaris]|nr:hypothetical protein DFH09DRAFT_1093639 [Mycena vulgaris]